MVSAVSWIFFEDKIETLGGFMKPDKKINWNLWGTMLGPRAGAEGEARSGGRSGGPRAQRCASEVSIYFFVRIHEYHPRFSILSSENIREYHWNHQKYQWIPGHKIKKICVVFIEIPLWWYFCQKCSCLRKRTKLFTIKSVWVSQFTVFWSVIGEF